jgi:hypothetical protein
MRRTPPLLLPFLVRAATPTTIDLVASPADDAIVAAASAGKRLRPSPRVG